MWACVIEAHWANSATMYSSFFSPDSWRDAILYAERMPGIVRIERAHAKEPPIWTRDEGLTQHGKELQNG